MTTLKDWKTGASTCCYNAATPDVVRAYARAGIAAMEISMDENLYGGIDFDALGKAAKAEGVELWSLHLPFAYTLSIAHADPACRKNAMDTHALLLKKAERAGITHAIIHPGTEPTKDCDRAQRLEESSENLYTLTELAKQHGIVLCVEELPRTCPGNCSAEISYLLQAHPDLRVCFDTNHLLLETHSEFIAALGNKIATLHVSDYDFIDERHQLPGEGSIDWKPLIAQLQDIGYNGPWMYEVRFGAQPGRRTGRTLTLEDFRQNQMQLAAL